MGKFMAARRKFVLFRISKRIRRTLLTCYDCETDNTNEPASKRPKHHEGYNKISQIRSSIKNIENILSNLSKDLMTRTVPTLTSTSTPAPPPLPPPPCPPVGLIVPKKILESRTSQQTNLLNELSNVFR